MRPDHELKAIIILHWELFFGSLQLIWWPFIDVGVQDDLPRPA